MKIPKSEDPEQEIVLSQERYRLPFHVFHDLMLKRVREVLLVSSLYDGYILEEDGRLSEQIFSEYLNLNLSSPPRITRAATAMEALKILKRRHFDLIITMRRVADMDPFTFGQNAKKIRSNTPIVLLLTYTADIQYLPPIDQREGIDKIFLWNGDSKIFLAIVKVIEDRLNATHDTETGRVQVIIVVEDSIYYYSIFLPLIYTEIMRLTQALIEEGVNDLQRLLRMRARPKILLAETQEQAIEYYEKYKKYVLGIISDVKFPCNKNSEPDSDAGYQLISMIRKESPLMPILLQSSQEKNRERADSLKVAFINKYSRTLLHELRKFILQELGFGKFVFRLETGEKVAEADNLKEFERALTYVPGESLIYHGQYNHFSNWLMARGEFGLAYRLRPYKVSQFKNTDALRIFLLDSIAQWHRELQEGSITDFSGKTFNKDQPFIRLGSGSLGGKGRGIAFLTVLLKMSNIAKLFPEIGICVPKTAVIGTDEFDRFIEENKLYEGELLSKKSDEEVTQIFLHATLPDAVREMLKVFLTEVTYPLAVRSSSLLEDSQYQPFAGVYATYMLPNDHQDLTVRLEQLEQAIKMVYASMFYEAPRNYIESIGQNIIEEKMAVVLQEVVGKRYEDRFYPHFAGVARSYNYYPLREMNPEDGICDIALGLGRTVVTGGRVLKFCPHYPEILPQFSSPEMALRNSQTQFFVLKMGNYPIDFTKGEEATLAKLDLKIAEKDQVLYQIASTYDPNDEIIRIGISRPGIRIINFASILKWDTFPLAPLLIKFLDIGKRAMGTAVEIEFAVKLDKTRSRPPTFYLLQIRPFITETEFIDVQLDEEERQNLFLFSTKAMGNGILGDIKDIVYIKPDTFDNMKTIEIAAEIKLYNQELAATKTPYVLIGLGRWGTKDRFLGIPVEWHSVFGASVFVETGLEDFDIEPSQGTHFFQNLISNKRIYFTVPYKSIEDKIDWEWLKKQQTAKETKYVRHIRLSESLTVKVDGKKRQGAIIKPIKKKEE
ncbi:MAG: PEP/pyruvate-binding domain-containing protein [Candidatus Hermodarchaeota archaeon]